MTELTGRFETAWHDLELPARRALELAYESLAGGGLACGAVINDVDGHRIAEATTAPTTRRAGRMRGRARRWRTRR